MAHHQSIAQLDDTLREICQRLIKVDDGIRDIILFGSAVYAPECAKDIDILITTKEPLEHDAYMDAVSDLPIQVDVIVRKVGERIGEGIAMSVVAFGKVIYGDGATIEEVKKFMPPPSFEDAREYIVIADRTFADAEAEEAHSLKDKLYRAAFDFLFDAGRSAVMAYLNTEETRWGELRRMLSSSFSERFREIINTLHIRYSYDGDYPRNTVKEAYHHWREIVCKFIDDLESAANVAWR